MSKTVLVCGGRYYDNAVAVHGALANIDRVHGVNRIVTGGCGGADALGEEWAEMHDVSVSTYIPNWVRHGKAAGPLRNQEMLEKEKPDLIIAFPGGKGTADMVRRGRKAGVEVLEINEPPTFVTAEQRSEPNG